MAFIRNNRVLVASIMVLLVAGLGVWIYAAPLAFPAEVHSAAMNRDTIRLEQLIDFDAVRDGLKSDLKSQLAGVVAQPTGSQPTVAQSGPAPASPDAGIAQGLNQLVQGVVAVVIDTVVDQLVTPRGLEAVIAGQPLTANIAGQSSQPLDGLFPKGPSGQRFRIDHRYLAFDRYRYTLTSATGKSSVDIDLQRSGLFGWRVERVTPNIDPVTLKASFTPPAPEPTPAAAQADSVAPPPPPPSDIAVAALPTDVGQCADTTVKAVSSRLDGDPDSGSAVSFADGGYQVSYDDVAAIDQSRPGDPINLCLVALPEDCPPGDDRGKTYKATNGRTGDSWTLPDSEHMCGGA